MGGEEGECGKGEGGRLRGVQKQIKPEAPPTHWSLEGLPQRGHLIQNAAQGPDIGLLGIWFAFAYLWRDITRSAHNLMRGEGEGKRREKG